MVMNNASLINVMAIVISGIDLLWKKNKYSYKKHCEESDD